MRSSLLYHERTHTAERPHKCLTCGKAFIQREKLLLHEHIIHIPVSDYINVSGVAWPCDEHTYCVMDVRTPKSERINVSRVARRSHEDHTYCTMNVGTLDSGRMNVSRVARRSHGDHAYCKV